MAIIMVIIDGAIPSDYKECKNIENIKKHGVWGKVNNTPSKMETNSLTCIMNILDVEDKFIPEGRAYLEALAINARVDNTDLVMRCNNVIIQNDILLSNDNSGIGNSIFSSKINNKVSLINMGTYKNLLVVKGYAKALGNINTYAPHENFGVELKKIMPFSKDKDLQNLFEELIKKGFYPWDESVSINLESFEDIHGLKGAIVGETEIVRGIGEALKMYVPKLNNCTADTDTDLIEKVNKTLELINEYDFVLLHINGADESAHRKNNKEKVEFIKKIDEVVINKIIKNISDEISLIVTSDHGTCSETGKHINGLVDYYILNYKEEVKLWLKK